MSQLRREAERERSRLPRLRQSAERRGPGPRKEKDQSGRLDRPGPAPGRPADRRRAALSEARGAIPRKEPGRRAHRGERGWRQAGGIPPRAGFHRL